MPHATEDEVMADFGQNGEMQGYMEQFADREIDQTDKAEDAVDYDDFSDDELPDEEEPSNQIQSPDDDEHMRRVLGQAAGGVGGGIPAQLPTTQTNGFHFDSDANGDVNGDLFGESDDIQDLFGDGSSSPEQQRARPVQDIRLSPQQRPSGLALPGRSSLALPGMRTASQPAKSQQMQQFPESMSPPSLIEGGYSPSATPDDEDLDKDEGLDDVARMQRRMFKIAARKQAGEAVKEDDDELDMDIFYSMYPTFEKNQNPDFLKLFPPRPVQYRAKVPLKPPRPLIPTKLSLDLMPDQEKSFRAPALAGKVGEDYASKTGIINIAYQSVEQDESDDDLALSTIDENERIGGVTMQDLAIICEDWSVPDREVQSDEDMMDGDWDSAELTRASKRRRILDSDLSLTIRDPRLSFEDPERAAAKLAKSVTLDLNDENLLVDQVPPQRKRKAVRDIRRSGALSRTIAKRYNISNDEAYDLLKENHQHKVRSTLGAMTIEHSMPATKLQYPFYKVNLDGKARRAFHRPTLDLRDGRGKEFRFSRTKHIKRKNIRGKEIKELFAHAEDIGLGDNSNLLLLEYSEEAPMMLSNFGMGNKLINYYRKRDADDTERPKREIGEVNVLLTQDKSPFANFGHVDGGEIVPTIHNGLFRAPVFQHKPKPTDFIVGLSSTYTSGLKFYLRNMENLHTVGQQLPTAEVPQRHSRKVTDAAKKRLRALSYRIYTKSIDPMRPKAKALNNENLMPHLPGHDMPQTRSKMREFMDYEKAGKEATGVWVPKRGNVVPDAETLRSWIKPEDICLLDSMQAGVQHLQDLGLPIDNKNEDDNQELDESEHIEKHLAPWTATKNFIGATQGKAMLKLYGDGDPTGRGEGYSFVKTSMKGGFAAHGESAQDKMNAKKRRETGGHSYNVADQQKRYDESIREIWDKQKASLSAEAEHSDVEMEDDHEEPMSAYGAGRGATPRSSFATPAARSRYEDESASQFSRGSANRRGSQVLIITRQTIDENGDPITTYEEVTNQKVIQQYNKRQQERKLQRLSRNELVPGADPSLDVLKQQELRKELARLQRNQERRIAREKQKGIISASGAGSPSGVGSPGQSDAGTGATTTPVKTGRGRNKDGTARKCANCGQVGHIKTNRKLCPMLNGTGDKNDPSANGDSSFGAVPAPLTL